jgi:hypothetical protein
MEPAADHEGRGGPACGDAVKGCWSAHGELHELTERDRKYTFRFSDYSGNQLKLSVGS